MVSGLKGVHAVPGAKPILRSGRPYFSAASISDFGGEHDGNDEEQGEDIPEDEEGEEEVGGGDNNMADIIKIMQNVQQTKLKTSSASSSAFNKKQAAIYKATKEKGDNIVAEGCAYFERAKARVSDLRRQEQSDDKDVQDLLALMTVNDQAVESVLDVYESLFGEPQIRRVEQVDAASAMLRDFPMKRTKSRRNLMKNFKTTVAQNLENEKIAADATALIAHYKALLRST